MSRLFKETDREALKEEIVDLLQEYNYMPADKGID